MEQYNQKILSALTQHLLDNDMSFCQALFELGINRYENQTNPIADNFLFRNTIIESSAQTYERIKQQQLKNKQKT